MRLFKALFSPKKKLSRQGRFEIVQEIDNFQITFTDSKNRWIQIAGTDLQIDRTAYCKQKIFPARETGGLKEWLKISYLT